MVHLVATACLLSTLSLALGKMSGAGILRRLSGFLFLLAFLPPLFFGLIPSSHTPVASHEGGRSIGTIIGFIILSLLSYAVLAIRKHVRGGKSGDAWSEYVGLRTAGKRPVDTDHAVRPPASLFEDRDER